MMRSVATLDSASDSRPASASRVPIPRIIGRPVQRVLEVIAGSAHEKRNQRSIERQKLRRLERVAAHRARGASNRTLTA